MMDVHTKDLFVFLFVGLVVLLAQGSALSSESATTEPEVNATRGTENEQEISAEAAMENEVLMNEPNLPIDFSQRACNKRKHPYFDKNNFKTDA